MSVCFVAFLGVSKSNIGTFALIPYNGFYFGSDIILDSLEICEFPETITLTI